MAGFLCSVPPIQCQALRLSQGHRKHRTLRCFEPWPVGEGGQGDTWAPGRVAPQQSSAEEPVLATAGMVIEV